LTDAAIPIRGSCVKNKCSPGRMILGVFNRVCQIEGEKR